MLVSKISGQCCVFLVVLTASYGAIGRPVSSEDHFADAVAAIATPHKSTLLEGGVAIPQGPIVSPLTYRRAFKINIPLKPKLIQRLQAIYKKKNLSAKRETKHAHYYQPRHAPFAKSIGMLFDDILNRHKYIANPQGTESAIRDKVSELQTKPLPDDFSPQYDSQAKPDTKGNALDKRPPESKEKQATASSSRAPETSSHSANTTKATLDRSVAPEVGDSRFFPISSKAPIPEIPSANSTNGGRTYERYPHGSGPANNGDDKRDVPRNSGHSENVSQVAKPGNFSESIPKRTEGTPRDSANSSISNNGSTREQGVANIGNRSRSRDNSLTTTEERTRKIGAGIKQFEVKDKVKDRGSEIKSDRKWYGSRIRGYPGTIEKYVDEESIQPNSDIRKSVLGNTQIDTCDKQKLDGNSTNTKQNKDSGTRDIDFKDYVINLGNNTINSTQPISPIEILSGYSNYTIEDSNSKP